MKESRKDLLKRIYEAEKDGLTECTINLRNEPNPKTIMADANTLIDEGYMEEPLKITNAIVLRLTDYGWDFAEQFFDEGADAMKEPIIFISHATKDKDYAEDLVELLEFMGLDAKQIFCSSIPGYDIPVGENIFDHIRSLYETHALYVVFMHSKNYYKSAVCLNEMGAAWVLRKDAVSFLVPGFDFADMEGVVNKDAIAIKLDSSENEVKSKLDQFFENIIQMFNIEKTKNVRWENKRDEFIAKVLSREPNEKGIVENSAESDVKLCFEIQVSEDRDNTPTELRTKYNPSDYCLEIYNVGSSPLFIRNIGIYYNGKIIVDCPMGNQKSMPYDDKLVYQMTMQDYDALCFHCRKNKIKTCDIWVNDVAGKCYKGLLDVEFLQISFWGEE